MRFLAPAELRGLDISALETLLERRELVVACGDGEVSGLASAALLFSGFAALDRGATLLLDTPHAWAGAAWRLGRRALLLQLEGRSRLVAEEAHALGLCDVVIDGAPDAWLERWMSGRSAMALDSAAALVVSHGGDRLERAEFARLFAAGEPQKGLRAFLERTKPSF